MSVTVPASKSPPQPSQRAIAAIIGFEVTDEASYLRFASRPTWPGAMSGVTIGIGYDLGGHPPIRQDWVGLLPSSQIMRLAAELGVYGHDAEAAAHGLHDIVVPFAAAITVFKRSTLPRYTARTLAAFPGCGDLHPDCFGALVSLVYNRGESMDGDRRNEMRLVRHALAAGKPEDVPEYIRDMKRLWRGADGEPLPGMAGLIRRREEEAVLFEAGLLPPAGEPQAAVA